jgi:hypothetical protein
MTAEAFCDTHGPYDASLGKCPFCAKERGLPQAPPALDDELETDPWGGRGRSAHASYDDEVTDPRGGPGGYDLVDEEVTEWPKRRGAAWDEDEDLTAWPERRGGRAGDWDDDATVVERSETGLLGFLIVKEGMRRGTVHRIRNGTTVGRKEARILVRDSKISRIHCKFTVEDDQFHIWDFGTPNGTFVNGTRIREATALEENDEIKIGNTTFVLKTLE